MSSPLRVDSLRRRCRACLSEVSAASDGVSLWEGAPPLAELLRRAARVKCQRDDGGPTLLCAACRQRLAQAFEFRQQAQAAHRRIRRLLRRRDAASRSPSPPSPLVVKVEPADVCEPSDEEPPPKRDCAVCAKTFQDARSLAAHAKIHSAPRQHTCDQCGKQFKYKDNLKVHAMTHTGEKPFQCDICNKSFSKKDNLAIHKKRHLQQRNYNCDQCGSAYYTSYELKTHKRVHTGEKPHVCNLCGKRFTAKNNLYIHQRSHTGEKPHICTVCGKGFISKNILSIHSRTHTGEKPYVCSVCGKRFAANKLAVHMRTHTGEKPHVCSLCGKQFSATNVLLIHMRRHTGEKPYECKICGQLYGHTQSLNKHMRRQHKIVTNAPQLKIQQSDESRSTKVEDCKDSFNLLSEPTQKMHLHTTNSDAQEVLISTITLEPTVLSKGILKIG